MYGYMAFNKYFPYIYLKSMIKLSHREPFVILLDLDNTIIGNVEPQLEESNLMSYINSLSTKNNVKLNQNLLFNDFRKGLLRSKFQRFIKRMRDRFPNVEFFIYTASNKDWAKYIIKKIELHINFNFNKRIFSRNDCMFDSQRQVYYKSIKKITPDIFSVLKSKYNLIGKKNEYNFKHILLIDNNDVLRDEERKYWVKCPHYLNKVIINPFRSIPDMCIKQYYRQIGLYLWKKNYDNVYRFYADSFDTLARKHNVANTSSDNFWEHQLKIFKREYQLI